MSAAAGTETAAGSGTTEASGASSEQGGSAASQTQAALISPTEQGRELARAREDAERYKRERDADRAKLTEAERAKMDGQQRAESERDEWKGKASASELGALKLSIALDQAPDGMTPKQVAKLAKRLTGNTEAELKADAVELFAEFAGAGDGKGEGGDEGKEGKPTTGRPRPNLRGGANNDDDETGAELDISKIPRL